MTELFALDLGNKQTKIKSKKGAYVAPSSLLNAREIESVFSTGEPDGLDKFQISSEDEIYFWGKNILDYPEDQLTDTLGFEGRYERAEYRRLATIALAKLAADYEESQTGVLEINVVVGLPTGDYSQLENAQKVLKAINRQQVVNVNGKPVTFNVSNVEVLPQPIGTLYDYLFNDKAEIIENGLDKRRYAIADIGGGTILLDQILFNNGNARFDSSNRNQSELGMNELYTRIAKKITQKTGVNADINIIAKALRNSKNSQYSYKQSENNVLNITDIVEQEINYYTSRLIEKINTTFKNLPEVDVLIFTGGGAAVVNRKLISDEIKQTKVIFSKNSEESNVNGFYKFGLLKY